MLHGRVCAMFGGSSLLALQVLVSVYAYYIYVCIYIYIYICIYINKDKYIYIYIYLSLSLSLTLSFFGSWASLWGFLLIRALLHVGRLLSTPLGLV